MLFYSKLEKGFFDTDICDSPGYLPDDSLPISKEQHCILLEGQGLGLEINFETNPPSLKERELPLTPLNILKEDIDTSISAVYGKWNKFRSEYESRVIAAKKYIANNNTNPSILITSVAKALKLTIDDTVNMILEQFKELEEGYEKLAELRMSKYELDELSLKEANSKFNEILAIIEKLNNNIKLY